MDTICRGAGWSPHNGAHHTIQMYQIKALPDWFLILPVQFKRFVVC